MQDPLPTILKTSFNQSDRTGLHAQPVISENNFKSGDRTKNSSVVSSWCISHFSILRNSETNGHPLVTGIFNSSKGKKLHFWYQGAAAPGALVEQNQTAGILFHLTIPEAYLKWLETIYLEPFVWNQQNRTLVYCTSYCSWSVFASVSGNNILGNNTCTLETYLGAYLGGLLHQMNQPELRSTTSQSQLQAKAAVAASVVPARGSAQNNTTAQL